MKPSLGQVLAYFCTLCTATSSAALWQVRTGERLAHPELLELVYRQTSRTKTTPPLEAKQVALYRKASPLVAKHATATGTWHNYKIITAKCG